MRSSREIALWPPTRCVRAISEIDRAASKGVIHSNNASRSKSRLMLRFNGLAE